MTSIRLCIGDLPKDNLFTKSVAVDTETTGLNPLRDRLCLVQLADDKGHCYLVKIVDGIEPVRLKKVLSDKKILKIFHFARFDVMMIKKELGIVCQPVYCTKIAHKLVRTNVNSHSLKTLCSLYLNVELDKEETCSDWAAEKLTPQQKKYAANDVLYLHKLKTILDQYLKREKRADLAQACFDFLPTRAALDLLGFDRPDIFEH